MCLRIKVIGMSYEIIEMPGLGQAIQRLAQLVSQPPNLYYELNLVYDGDGYSGTRKTSIELPIVKSELNKNTLVKIIMLN